MTEAELIAAVRFTALSLMAAKGMLALNIAVHIDSGKTIAEQFPWFHRSRRRVFCGMTLVSFAWAIHQAYWWLWQLGVVYNHTELQAVLQSTTTIIVAMYAMIFVGCVLVMSGWLESRVGRWWPAVAVASVCGLLALGAPR